MQVEMARKGAATTAGASSAAPTASQYAIGAAGTLHGWRALTLKQGDTFAVLNEMGDALQEPSSREGVFHCDTRHLSHYRLTIAGARPMLLSGTVREDNAMLTCDLTNPDLTDAQGGTALDHDLIHIRRSQFLWNAAYRERIVLHNFDQVPRRVQIELEFAADFADLFEVRGARRPRRGETRPPEIGASAVKLSYLGLDQRLRTTLVQFEPVPAQLSQDEAQFVIDLAPGQSRSVFVEVNCNPIEPGSARRGFFVAFRDRSRASRGASSRASSMSAVNEGFNEVVRRSVSDLYMLVTDLPEGPFPYAGVPWFSTTFGRDAVITALATLWLDPAIAAGVLGHLAATQATTINPEADAEPGKILHEARHGEMANLGEVPFHRYYGSVDSTPLFVVLAGAYLDRTGDIATLVRLWPNIEAALEWMERFGDHDGDGFIEYGRQSANGLVNQGWKDSNDSIFHADGTLARGPIAVVEVQAYAYAAWRAAERIMLACKAPERAHAYRLKADTLQRRFDEAFFDEALGAYVLALDGDKRPCRVRASNAGHALFGGIAYPERAESVMRLLTSSAFFGGWGVRTLATTEARYNPMSYHNGSVWPHDNAMIAAGFSAYGYRAEAAKVFEGLFAASSYIDLRRLPELYCGFPRKQAQGPTLYPVACSPQAWASTAPLSLIQSCIGLSYNPAAMQITFRDPVLPNFIDNLVLRRLAVRGGSADVVLRRSGRRVVVDVLERRGPVQVVTIN